MITSNANAAIIYDLSSGTVTVSDPSQNLTSLTVKLDIDLLGKKPPHWGKHYSRTLSYNLPTSGAAGSSVSQHISD